MEVHVEAQLVLHIQVKPSDKFKLNRTSKKGLIQRILQVPFHSWFLIELFSTLFLCYYLFKLNVQKKFDIINFHIAYPLLTYWYIIKRIIDIPVIITEHWSAYHFNFGVKDSNKLKRIKRIFNLDLPVICVSEALKADIQGFSCNYSFPVFVVPNIVSEEFINHSSPQESRFSNAFFMVSSWNWPKKPSVVIDAFSKFIKESKKEYFLRVAGFGGLLSEMEKQVVRLGINDKVIFLGKLNSDCIAEEMKFAIAFLHCSEYETFSVVCAEALCSGCPVIASKVGGITEFVDSENGILVNNNDKKSWNTALTQFHSFSFCKKNIGESAAEKFSSKRVGESYYKVLSKVYYDTKK